MENSELEKENGVYMTTFEYRKYCLKEKYKEKKKTILAILYAILLSIGIYYFM